MTSKVSKSIDLDAAADKVWGKIGDFNSLADWHPAVANSELQENDQVRKLTLGDGAVIMERKKGGGAMSYSYSIESGPLPVSNYVSEISVAASNAGCTVTWSSEFDPVGPAADAEGAIAGVYEAGLNSLKEMFGS
ncbi:MAG: SRPBCC family protein [Gammaproteobacteria bacterium]